MAKRMAHSRMARFAVFWFNVFALIIFTLPASASANTTIPSSSATIAYSLSVQSNSFITATSSLDVQTSTLAFTSSISPTGNVSVVPEMQQSSSSIVPTSTAKMTTTVPSSSATLTPLPTTATPRSLPKPTNVWDKAIDLATPLGTFIIVIVAVALVLILLIALICVCCKYRGLKKRTHLFDHMTINDSEWIRSNDDLLMWERNLRASEVKTNNGVSNRPFNEKRS